MYFISLPAPSESLGEMFLQKVVRKPFSFQEIPISSKS